MCQEPQSRKISKFLQLEALGLVLDAKYSTGTTVLEHINIPFTQEKRWNIYV